jgi:hypothetical protein
MREKNNLQIPSTNILAVEHDDESDGSGKERNIKEFLNNCYVDVQSIS